MSLLDLYKAFNVDIAPQGDPRYRDSWVNTECPYCAGSFGYHLGFDLEHGFYNCYRCGVHPIPETLGRILGQDKSTVYRLIKEYDVKIKDRRFLNVDHKASKISVKAFKYPRNIISLKKTHKRYLEGRGFNPSRLQRIFDLHATTNTSTLDKINYAFRILAPIYWEGRIVSFQARDYTGKQEMRYLACPMAREILHHKYILYMNPKGPKKIGFAVEGIADVWRFYKNGFATFGIEYTTKQLKIISKLYDKVFIIFDPETQAQIKAKRLKKELEFRGMPVENIVLDSDPGDLPQEEADRLTKDINKKSYVVY